MEVLKEFFKDRCKYKFNKDENIVHYILKLKFDTKFSIPKEYENMVKDLIIEIIYYVKLNKIQINRLYKIIYIIFLYDDFYIRAKQLKRYDIIKELNEIRIYLSQNLFNSNNDFNVHFEDYIKSLEIEQLKGNNPKLIGINYLRLKPRTMGTFLTFLYTTDLNLQKFNYYLELLIYLAEKDMTLVNDLFSFNKDIFAKNETNSLNNTNIESVINKINENYYMMIEINEKTNDENNELIFALINGVLSWSFKTERYLNYQNFVNNINIVFNNNILFA